jgi:hypothetical protein
LVLPALLVSVPVGVTVWLLARRDRGQMADGLMDPQGRDEVEEAQRLAFSGAVLPLLPTAVVLGMVVWALLRAS